MKRSCKVLCVSLAFAVLAVGCKPKVYSDKVLCGETQISTLETIQFAPGTPVKTVAQEIPKFCLCDAVGDYPYHAYVPITWNDVSGEFEFAFDEEQNFQWWWCGEEYDDDAFIEDFDAIHEACLTVYQQTYEELGEPAEFEEYEDGGFRAQWLTDQKDAEGNVWKVTINLTNPKPNPNIPRYWCIMYNLY